MNEQTFLMEHDLDNPEPKPAFDRTVCPNCSAILIAKKLFGTQCHCSCGHTWVATWSLYGSIEGTGIDWHIEAHQEHYRNNRT